MEISDDGPGIFDIDKAMQAGFSTASDEHREMGFGAGMGLPNMKKNADEIIVESEKGHGTRVRMVFYIKGGGGEG
jgi:anti-sigma regulatory factor (Ser/Thr protein kinase)